MEDDVTSGIYPYNAYRHPFIHLKEPAEVDPKRFATRLQRMIIPTIMPTGLDALQIVEERDRLIDARFLIQRPEESLPRYTSPTPTYAAAPAPAPSREQSSSRESSRSHSERSRSHRQPSPARSDSSRSSRSSTYTSSSFASPMSYRETIQIPDSPRPETPPPFPGHTTSPSRYGRNPGAF
ncbi:hypothetical protein B0H14DRAFT_2643720 [Mycena olivaceomarginata]|nr:hypothetical protein B0H14DRAFT_2643720 [Mycena olivaceomarginata]